MEKLTKKERKELKKQENLQKLEKEQKQKTYKKIAFWIVGIVILGLIIWGVAAVVSAPKDESSNTVSPITSADVATGSATAKANLIEYADFECPACAEYSKFVEQLRTDYPKDLRVAYRFFPLPQHQYGMLTAQVAYAAAKQSKFWEMYKLLYDNQASWAASPNAQGIFDDYAKQLNLNLTKFHNDENADSTKNLINNSYNQGINIGINSTPTFYLNGNVISPTNFNDFKSLVQNEINKK